MATVLVLYLKSKKIYFNVFEFKELNTFIILFKIAKAKCTVHKGSEWLNEGLNHEAKIITIVALIIRTVQVYCYLHAVVSSYSKPQYHL